MRQSYMWYFNPKDAYCLSFEFKCWCFPPFSFSLFFFFLLFSISKSWILNQFSPFIIWFEWLNRFLATLKSLGMLLLSTIVIASPQVKLQRIPSEWSLNLGVGTDLVWSEMLILWLLTPWRLEVKFSFWADPHSRRCWAEPTPTKSAWRPAWKLEDGGF